MSPLYYYHTLTGNKNKQFLYLFQSGLLSQAKKLLNDLINKTSYNIKFFKIIDKKIKSNNISFLFFIVENVKILNYSLSCYISYKALEVDKELFYIEIAIKEKVELIQNKLNGIDFSDPAVLNEIKKKMKIRA